MVSRCKTCQIEFVVASCKRKFCSLPCYHKSLKTLDKFKHKVCKYCHKPFGSKEKSKKQIDLNKYCSKYCRRQHQVILQKTGSCECSPGLKTLGFYVKFP
jgi:hypothetical protein